MSQNAEDRWLDRTLHELPRERASSSFTTRLMRRIESGARPSAAPRLRWVAAAAVVLLAAGLWGAALHRERRAEARFETLRAEYHAARAELEELRRLQAASRGVVYLGSTDDVDLVVDLRRLARRLEEQRRRTEEPLPGEVHPALLVPAGEPRLTPEGEIYR